MKLSGATVASPYIGRVLAWAATEKLHNWAANLEYSTDKVFTATFLEQVQESVKKNDKLKALGSRHCLNNIADSKDAFISLKPVDKVIALDPAKRTVTVSVGITYDWLDRPRPKGDYGMGAFYKSIDTVLWGRKTCDMGLDFQKKGVTRSGFDTRVKNYVFTRSLVQLPAPAGVEFVSETHQSVRNPSAREKGGKTSGWPRICGIL